MSSKAKDRVRKSTTRTVQHLSSHKFPFLLSILFLPALFLAVSEAVCNPQDRESLLWFAGNITSSVSPLNWNPSIDCCSWDGITCDDLSDSRVTAISLPFRGLSGNLTSSVLNLQRLSILDLSHNHFSGPLPHGLLSVFDQLMVLNLSYNNFSGEMLLEQAFGNGTDRVFPIQTVDLSSNFLHGEILDSSNFLQGAFNLTSFNVSNNSFIGPIPSFICTRSPQLSKLDFSYNGFTGQISQGLGGCLKLTVLRAGFNNLSGEIPTEIYNLSMLEQIFLPVNHFSGSIHGNITLLRNLKSLELYFNNLQGEIPIDIGELSSLGSLQLHINNLTGGVPLSLAKCTNLVNMNLRVNRLEGTLTELDFSQFQNLSILDLGNNSFSGEFPERIYSCKCLTALRFEGNKLTGQISPQVLELESLSFLSLSANNLTNITGTLNILQGCRKLSTLIMAKNFRNEKVPSNKDFIATDGFPELKILVLGASGLEGEIPAWLIKLKSLQVLDLSVNRLQGSVPGWLGTLPNLYYIDLTDNLLSGELPKEFFQLTALMSQKTYDAIDRPYLKLPIFVTPKNTNTNIQYNQVSSLPTAIYITRNQLIGSIPVEVGQLKVLQGLELSYNKLSGSIPDELSNLTNLESLDLSNNNLSGRIPWSLDKLYFMYYFNVANNSLEGPIGSVFETFPRSCFEGNPLLCGGVLMTSCTVATPAQQPAATTDTEELKRIFIMGVGIGYFFTFTSILLMLFCYSVKTDR